MDGGTLDLLPPLPWSSMRLPGPPGQATDQSRSMVAEESMEAKVVKARGANALTYTVKKVAVGSLPESTHQRHQAATFQALAL
ncbi:hypothetical protein HaLaN_03110 [Haematococcus lacustris]|uniref:Uncharacterized protein n=1 Tax=Haematococcus lacustris TaxID=44745 RepID=A0A699YJT7_HAELA|nr:hypothetical protein HaLaN_03110 [Haematococcus lacustris]